MKYIYTEKKIIQRLHSKYFATDIFNIDNCYLFDWESDFIRITKSGYIYEYEIKISRADFKKDFKKTEKHEILKTGERPARKTETFYPSIMKNINERFNFIKKRPNYFYYVCPENLIDIKDVPEYAGFISLKLGLNIIKKAPKLHTDKITDELKTHILKSMYFKYWNIKNKYYKIIENRK